MSVENARPGIPRLNTGGCACGAIRYELRDQPLIVHCCHCTYCQHETGAAFAINLLIETNAVRLLRGVPQPVLIPTHSGLGQKVARCPICMVAVWSNYLSITDKVSFVRGGTLDSPDEFPPDIHIYTNSRQRWLPLPAEALTVSEYYRARDVWKETSLARYKLAKSSTTTN